MKDGMCYASRVGEMMDNKNEWLIALATVLVLSLARIALLLRTEYCLWWDCPAYLTWIQNHQTIIPFFEPVYFAVTNALNYFIGNEVVAVKLMMLLMPVLLSVGVFALLRRFYPFKTAMLGIIIANLLIGLNRIWADEYRNYLCIAMFPLFILMFMDNMKSHKQNIQLGNFYGLLLLTHSVAILLLPMFAYWGWKRKELIKEFVFILGLGFFFYFGFQLIFGVSYGLTSIGNDMIASTSPPYNFMRGDILSMMSTKITMLWLWSSGLFLLPLLFCKRKWNDLEKSLLVCFGASLIAGMSPFFYVIANRILLTSMFFLSLLIAPILADIIKTKKTMSILIASAVILMVIWQGVSYISSLDDLMTPELQFAYGQIRYSNDTVISSIDQNRFSLYLTGREADHYILNPSLWKSWRHTADDELWTMRVLGDDCQFFTDTDILFDTSLGFWNETNLPCFQLIYNEENAYLYGSR